MYIQNGNQFGLLGKELILISLQLQRGIKAMTKNVSFIEIDEDPSGKYRCYSNVILSHDYLLKASLCQSKDVLLKKGTLGTIVDLFQSGPYIQAEVELDDNNGELGVDAGTLSFHLSDLTPISDEEAARLRGFIPRNYVKQDPSGVYREGGQVEIRRDVLTTDWKKRPLLVPKGDMGYITDIWEDHGKYYAYVGGFLDLPGMNELNLLIFSLEDLIPQTAEEAKQIRKARRS